MVTQQTLNLWPAEGVNQGSNPYGAASKVAETLAIIVNSDMGMDSIGSELGESVLQLRWTIIHKCDVRNEEGRKHTGLLEAFPLDFMASQFNWLKHRPVTSESAGSSPAGAAIAAVEGVVNTQPTYPVVV